MTLTPPLSLFLSSLFLAVLSLLPPLTLLFLSHHLSFSLSPVSLSLLPLFVSRLPSLSSDLPKAAVRILSNVTFLFVDRKSVV